MVKIRLKRLGSKGRPFYRIVVAQSTTGRDGKDIDVLGTYNPVSQPKQLKIDGEKALRWLLSGAQPTETVGYLLNKEGILDQFFAQRPKARRAYKFLDKRAAAISVPSVVSVAEPAAVAPAPAPEPAVEAPAEMPVEPVAEAQTEAPAEIAAETPAEAEPTPGE